MLCHKHYHTLLQALAKICDISGLIYAAHQLTALLGQTILLAVSEPPC